MADDFEYLSESRVDEETLAQFRFDNIAGEAIFECAPAIPTCNRAYASALIEAINAGPKRKKPKKGAPPPSEAAQKAAELQKRLRDAGLFAEHCVRRWIKAPVLRIEERDDGQGGKKKVAIRAEYSVEATRRFLEALATKAPNVFDLFRFWLHSEDSFQQLSGDELEEESGNSERG